MRDAIERDHDEAIDGDHGVTDVVNETDDRIADLERAATRLDGAQGAIDEIGAATIDRGARAYREASQLLTDYEDRATGTGGETFKAYIELEGKFATLVEGLPEDLPHRGAFEAALNAIDRRRLRARDFERARVALEPAADLAERQDDLDRAREAYREARRAAARHRSVVEKRIESCDRLLDLGDVDLDAPVERLRDPVRAYDEAISEAFETYIQETSAREVLSFVETTAWYPLVEFTRPPRDLLRYVERTPVGAHPIPKLLEYADYSRSKLDHYVDDPDELKRQVATERTYLERLDGEALTVGWPPAPANALRWRLRELVSVVSRIADDEVVERLHAVRSIVRDGEYERLQRAAAARDRLDERERERLRSGIVERERERLVEARQRLHDVLETYPSR